MSIPKAGALERATDWSTVFPVDTDAWPVWTPTITQSGSVAFTTNRARYNKIGRWVHLSADLTVTGAGTGANNVIIAGLPFAATYVGNQVIGSGNLFDTSATQDYTAVLRFQFSTTQLALMNTRAHGLLGVSGFTAALAAGDVITLVGSYEAAS